MIIDKGVFWPASTKDQTWLEQVTGLKVQRENPIHEDSMIYALFSRQEMDARCKELLENQAAAHP